MLGCPLTDEEVSALVDQPTLELKYQVGKVGEDKQSYQSTYDDILKKLDYDDFKLKYCGEITEEFSSSKAYLKHDSESKSVTLSGDESSVEEIYEQAFIELKFHTYSLKIPIRAEFEVCKVQKLSFAKTRLSVAYKIGAGPQSESLPKVVQEPDCGLSFDTLKMSTPKTSLPADKVAAAIIFDSDQNILDIETDDLSLLADPKIAYEFEIEQDLVEDVAPLKVEIKLETDPPSFDRSGLEVDTITCSSKDKGWSFDVPPINPSDAGPYSVEVQKTENSDFFTLENGKVSYTGSADSCPAVKEVSLEFKLTSKLIGEATETITVSV